MKIDIFPHIFPQALYDRASTLPTQSAYLQKRTRNLPILMDLDLRFRVMDQFPEYQQVLTLASPPLETMGDPKVSPDLARIANDSMAEIAAKYPDRFPAFVASLPMNNPEAAVQEAERAITQLGARGVQIYSNVNGRPLDEPEFRPLFARMAHHDLPLWIHPARSAAFPDYLSEKKSRYEMWWVFGWLYETTLAMGRLVFAGIFDDFPNIKIIAHHVGAMIPIAEGRLGMGLDQLGVRTPENEKDLVQHTLKRRPLDYFRMFYADTASFGSTSAIECGLAFFGVDRLLFGTDMPFDPEKGPGNIRETIRNVEEMTLAPADRQKIYEGNARRLLKLSC